MKGLADLPHFETLEFLPTTRFGVFGFLGRFNQTQGVWECPCWLRISADECSQGRLHALKRSEGTAIFIPSVGKEYIRLGMALPWIDSHWKKNDVEMVLDPSWSWKRVRFEPRDAWKKDTDIGAIVSETADGATGRPPGATLVPGGWDHDHCRFCWEKIGVGGVPEGFRDSHGTWLCEGCFNEYVLQHDLSFMEVHGKMWPAATPDRPRRRLLRLLKRGFARR
jgi:hypothetical protein